MILCILFSQPTRYAGFVSQLAPAPNISNIRSQMEPRSPLLSSPIPIEDCRFFFAINRIPDGSSLLRKDARKDARCGKQRLDYSEGVYNNREVVVRAQCAIGGVCNDQLRELRVIN